ncbi:MAG: hypothetical protein C0485_17275 [Pirellula sp.]|nr:hypothetical protein [Pirellula sp.]
MVGLGVVLATVVYLAVVALFAVTPLVDLKLAVGLWSRLVGAFVCGASLIPSPSPRGEKGRDCRRDKPCGSLDCLAEGAALRVGISTGGARG